MKQGLKIIIFYFHRSSDYMPNTYVSYPTAESTIPSYSTVFHNSDNPVWDHEHETKLDNEMLHQENKHLVFKVWHKPDGAPKSPGKIFFKLFSN